VCVRRSRRGWSSSGRNETASSTAAWPWCPRSRLGTTDPAHFANEERARDVATGQTSSSRAGPAGAEARRHEARGRARVAGAMRHDARRRTGRSAPLGTTYDLHAFGVHTARVVHHGDAETSVHRREARATRGGQFRVRATRERRRRLVPVLFRLALFKNAKLKFLQ
jgi:hypothetical protein